MHILPAEKAFPSLRGCGNAVRLTAWDARRYQLESKLRCFTRHTTFLQHRGRSTDSLHRLAVCSAQRIVPCLRESNFRRCCLTFRHSRRPCFLHFHPIRLASAIRAVFLPADIDCVLPCLLQPAFRFPCLRCPTLPNVGDDDRMAAAHEVQVSTSR